MHLNLKYKNSTVPLWTGSNMPGSELDAIADWIRSGGCTSLAL